MRELPIIQQERADPSSWDSDRLCFPLRKAAPTCWKVTRERPEPTWLNDTTRGSSAPTWWRPTRTSSETVWQSRRSTSSSRTVSVSQAFRKLLFRPLLWVETLQILTLLFVHSPDLWTGWFLRLLQSWVAAAHPQAAGRGARLLWERQWVHLIISNLISKINIFAFLLKTLNIYTNFSLILWAKCTAEPTVTSMLIACNGLSPPASSLLDWCTGLKWINVFSVCLTLIPVMCLAQMSHMTHLQIRDFCFYQQNFKSMNLRHLLLAGEGWLDGWMDELTFSADSLLREHHLSDHWRWAVGAAAASQESEEEGEDTSRSV